jgi:Regulator of ribonuclease activity B
MTVIESLHDNAVADAELLRSNDALGDQFKIAREVDFDFETSDGERANLFAEFMNGKNYGRATVTSIDGGNSRILVVIEMPITQHLICSVSGLMLCLSRLFQVEYKGWGSVVQKSNRRSFDSSRHAGTRSG